jgi:4-carboxymuconolactone decarboxylase
MVDREEVLRRLTLGDEAYLDALIVGRRNSPMAARLTYRDDALVRLGALAALGGSDLTWQQAVAAAIDAGSTPDEIVDALLAVAPMIGFTRLVSIAPKVSLALGFDVEAAIEAPAPRGARAEPWPSTKMDQAPTHR